MAEEGTSTGDQNKPRSEKTKAAFKLFEYEDELNDLSQDIQNTLTLALSLEADPSKSPLFKAKLSRLDYTYERFIAKVQEARSFANEIENKSILTRFEKLRTQVRTSYYEILSIDMVEPSNRSCRVSMDRTISDPNPYLRLPTINLPHFSGDIATWVTFKNTFISLVHQNPELNDVQRYHYLKSALKGTALQAVSSAPMTATGYTQAWVSLLKKYDNKRIQATHYIAKIFSFKPLQKTTYKSLESFCETVLGSVIAFRNLQIPDPEGFILLTYSLRLLDAKLRDRFEIEHGSNTEIPTYNEFADFIHQQCVHLQADTLTSSIGTPFGHSSYTASSSVKVMKQTLLTSNDEQSNRCPCCQERHRLYRCRKFKHLKPEQRLELVKRNNICPNCLGGQHAVSKCTSSFSCFKCKKQHNSLLHIPDESDSHPNEKTRVESATMPTTSKNNNVSTSSSEFNKQSTLSTFDSDVSVLLGTACAMIQDKEGNFHPIRILVDCGSQRSFLSSACAKKLGLKWDVNSQTLLGFGDSPIQGGNYQALCTLAPKTSLHPQLQTKAVIVPKIVERAPLYPVPKEIKDHFPQLDLADETFWKPSTIDFLLGADLFGQILTGDCIPADDGYPDALGTIFGWIIMGTIHLESLSKGSMSVLSVSSMSSAANLDNLVQKFWEVESVPQISKLSPDEVLCENHFISTHCRDDNGRYMVRLPFKNNEAPELGDSYPTALSRFRKLEYRLDKNPSLKAEYNKMIRQHLELDYISETKEEGKYFLPHHAVVKDNDLTKVRIVFDASSQTVNGSLNDHLLPGPKLQQDIRHIILSFRRFQYAITTDICQMFLQVLVHPEDRVFQHFIYRFNATDPVTTFSLNRVTFGMASSPYLAIRVTHQLVSDEGSPYPEASKALLQNTYVDDILTGADTLEGALDLQRQLISLLGKGGFTLKKWSSNSPQLLNTVSENQKPLALSPADNPTVKLLGLQWDPSKDCLSYRLENIKLVLTKRGILSAVARMYDPLGYLAPVVFKAKSYLQQSWSLELKWDEALPEGLARECEDFFSSLQVLSSIQIPRCIFPETPSKITLVGFADASTIGYAATIYLRILFPTGEVRSNLIISKTRLAPLKSISIPRLELSAALLLTQTLQSIKEFLVNLTVSKIYLLSDSSVVLSWIRLPPHTLKTFVGNRVTMILEHSSLSNWFHVHTLDNAADLASRGLTPQALVDNSLWYSGPPWLSNPESDWPISNHFSLVPVPELKPSATVLASQTSTPYFIVLMAKFHSFGKLNRIFAYVIRFVSNCRKRTSPRRHGALVLSELREATLVLVKTVQDYYFPQNSPSTKSAWEALSVFQDSSGVFRVGGRLKHSPLDYDARHPIVLPPKAHLTLLVIDHFHINYLHAGPQLLLSLLRRKYWIISARRVVRMRVHNCVKCHRFRAANYAPMMGNLPPTRFEQGRAFINVGIDFAGPFTTKESNRRKAQTMKSYLCLFVCLSTKAVHAELVSQLTTDAFLAALDRFVARRGLPSKIMSDHGTNFLGAQRRLKEIHSWLSSKDTQDTISQHLSMQQVEWEFIPPSAPHFGGLWEAGVKSFKHHLNRVIGDKILTFEALNTFLIRIEAVLNSRPLYPLSSSPDDLDTLTPGHFLIGGPQLALPEYPFEETSSNRLDQWQLLSKCVQIIWSRWRRDYLNSLQQRVKWTKNKSNIRLNSLVLLKEQNVPPLQWPTGRVIELFPGKDGIVRVVKIKTAKGVYMRPVAKLAPLLPTDG